MRACSLCTYSAAPICVQRESTQPEDKGLSYSEGNDEIRNLFCRVAICFRALCCYPLNSIIGIGPSIARSVSRMHVKFDRTRKNKERKFEVSPKTSDTLTESASKYSKVLYKMFKGNSRHDRTSSTSGKPSTNDCVSMKSSHNWNEDSTETLKANKRAPKNRKRNKKRKSDAKKFLSEIIPDFSKDFSSTQSYWNEINSKIAANNVRQKTSKTIQKDLFSPKMSMSEFVNIFRVHPPLKAKTIEESGLAKTEVHYQTEDCPENQERVVKNKESSKFRTKFPFFRVKSKKFSEIFANDANRMIPEEIVINYSNRSGKRQCLVLPLTKAFSGDGTENIMKSKSVTVVQNRFFEVKTCTSCLSRLESMNKL